MSALFKSIVVPNIMLRYLHSSNNLLWLKHYGDMYRIGIKNEAMIGIKEFSPIYIDKTDKNYVYQGDVIITVETDKTIFNLHSPFDAKVIGFNFNFANNLRYDTNYEEIFSWLIALKKQIN